MVEINRFRRGVGSESEEARSRRLRAMADGAQRDHSLTRQRREAEERQFGRKYGQPFAELAQAYAERGGAVESMYLPGQDAVVPLDQIKRSYAEQLVAALLAQEPINRVAWMEEYLTDIDRLVPPGRPGPRV